MKIPVILLLLILLGGCSAPPPDPAPTLSPGASATPNASSGEPSPTFTLTSPDGSTVAFDPAENGEDEAFLLLFWSYRWDPNVETFLERAAELHERYAPRGLIILGVSYDEEPAGLRAYLSERSVPFQVAVGTDPTYRDFQVESIPTAILVDKEGRIVDRWTGYFTTEELSDRISPHLPGRGGNSDG